MKRLRDDSPISEGQPWPGSQKMKLRRAQKKHREKRANGELFVYRDQDNHRGPRSVRNTCPPGLAGKGGGKGAMGLPAIMDRHQKQGIRDTDGKTEICKSWNLIVGKCASSADCRFGPDCYNRLCHFVHPPDWNPDKVNSRVTLCALGESLRNIRKRARLLDSTRAGLHMRITWRISHMIIHSPHLCYRRASAPTSRARMQTLSGAAAGRSGRGIPERGC